MAPVVGCAKLSSLNASARHAAVPALGSVSIAFVCHPQTYLVLGFLCDPIFYLARWQSRATALSLTEVFDNYEVSTTASAGLLNTAPILLAVNMIITFPGEMVVARQTVESVLERRRHHVRWLMLDAPVLDVALLALGEGRRRRWR